MRRTLRNSLTAGICAAVLASVVLIVRHSPAAEPTTAPVEEAGPVASVQTTPLHQGQIDQTITAYGVVTAEPGSIAVYSVPFDCRIKHVLVSAGQQIDNNTSLLEIEPSADASLQILEAANALDAANKDLAQTQQRFDMKLATNQDLLQSQQNQQTAQVKVQSFHQRGAADDQGKINAKAAGVISKIDVQDGQVVPADGSLVQVVPSGKIEVRLGAEPADLTQLHVGQIVRFSAAAGERKTGKIRFISSRIDPESRLVNVLVSLESSDSLLLDASVRGEIIVQTKQALVVPRSAVLPDDKAYSLFNVKDGHAVKHAVSVGLMNDNQVEIIGDGLKEGDLVVVNGNMELEDGMSVTAEGTP